MNLLLDLTRTRFSLKHFMIRFERMYLISCKAQCSYAIETWSMPWTPFFRHYTAHSGAIIRIKLGDGLSRAQWFAANRKNRGINLRKRKKKPRASTFLILYRTDPDQQLIQERPDDETKKLILRFRVPDPSVASPFPIGRFVERRIEQIYDQPSPTIRPTKGEKKIDRCFISLSVCPDLHSHPYA